jgi:gamma-butyrobetaine dioxygenase
MFRLIARQLFRKKQGLLSTTRLSSNKPVAQTITQHNDLFLAIQWNDGKVDEFPHFYLRENCSCPQCFQPLKNARNMFAPKELNLDVTAESVKLDSDQLNVKWNDGHSSVFSSENLQSLRYVHCVTFGISSHFQL